MEYQLDRKDKEVRASIKGQFTFQDSQKFKQILSMLESDDIRNLALDFSETHFIDSAALGMLLMLRDRCQNRHIPLSIHAIKGQVKTVFDISKFDELFTIAS